MKHFYQHLKALPIFFFLFSIHITFAQTIVNGGDYYGFEKADQGWKTHHPKQWSISEEKASSGTKCLKFSLPATQQLASSALYSIDTKYTIMKVRVVKLGTQTQIVASTYEGMLLGIDYNGTVLWKTDIGNGIMNHDLWCGDIDNDGLDEIFAASANGKIYCLNHKGKQKWEFQQNNAPMYSVCVIRKDNTPYVVCGSYDKSIYYLSASGELLKEIKSETYSKEKSWGKGTIPPKGLHIANFIRTAKKADGNQILIVQGTLHSMSSPGSLYMFEPMADTPFKTEKLEIGGPIGDLRIQNIDGKDEVLIGTSGMLESADFMRLKLETEEYTTMKAIAVRKKMDYFGYRVLQATTIGSGNNQGYLVICGSRIILLPQNMDAKSAEVLVCKYAFNDLWKDTQKDKIILASAQSGGSCIHIIDPNNPEWKEEYKKLVPSGKISQTLDNTTTARNKLKTFTRPAWEREPRTVYLMSDGTGGVEAIADNIKKNYKSPIFLNYIWMNKVQDPADWNRDAMENEKYRTRRDRRKNYSLTQQEVLDKLTPAFNNTSGIATWGGHGNDPYYYSLETQKKIIDAAAGKKIVLVFPELEQHDENFAWVLNDLIYPLAEYGKDKNLNIFVRTKHTFWQSIAHMPMWSRMASGEFADVFVPAMEETTDKSMELSVASRMGFWMSGATNSWGSRCSRDNTSFDRLRQHSHQMIPNHFLRQLVYNVSSGARHINNFTVDQKYHSFIWELIAKGALYVPQREELLSISPIQLGMMKPDEYYLNEGNNVKWLTFFDEQKEEENSLVFSHLNGSWPGAPVTEWDFSRYAAGVKDRRLNYLPNYPNGLVLITPEKSELKDKLHPIYKDITKKYLTDGRNYYSADKLEKYSPKEYYKTIEADIKAAAQKLPLTVSGNVAWVVAQTSPTHLRLTLIDGGYINPKDREAIVSFHSVQPKAIKDLVDGKNFPATTTLKIDVPCGLFRFIDIELSEELKR